MQSTRSRPTTAKKNINPFLSEKPKTSRRTPAEEEKGLDSVQLHQIYDTINQLIIKQKECEKTGKYVEAESFKKKVKKYREHAEQQEFEEIKKRHGKDLQEIEEAHIEEINCFNLEWDKTITDFNKEIEKMQEQLTSRHQQQIKTIEEEIQAQKPRNFHESPQLLNLRKIEQELAKQQSYIEAHHVQQKAAKLEKEEIDKWKKNQSSKGKNMLNILKQKQEGELKALNQRIELGVEEKERVRKAEYEQLIHKYENVVKEIEFQQNQELAKFTKAAKMTKNQKITKPGMFASTSKVNF